MKTALSIPNSLFKTAERLAARFMSTRLRRLDPVLAALQELLIPREEW